MGMCSITILWVTWRSWLSSAASSSSTPSCNHLVTTHYYDNCLVDTKSLSLLRLINVCLKHSNKAVTCLTHSVISNTIIRESLLNISKEKFEVIRKYVEFISGKRRASQSRWGLSQSKVPDQSRMSPIGFASVPLDSDVLEFPSQPYYQLCIYWNLNYLRKFKLDSKTFWLTLKLRKSPAEWFLKLIR